MTFAEKDDGSCDLGPGTFNLPRSKGFEGMAVSPSGRKLYPMLEGALTTDPDQRRLMISEFDVKRRSYTGRRWFYRLDKPAFAIGDLTTLEEDLFLVIERDNNQGGAAAFKKIFIVDLKQVDSAGFLIKHEVADLLQIDDPHGVGGFGPAFRFPFQTIESVIPLGSRRLGILDDNNYPSAPHATPGSRIRTSSSSSGSTGRPASLPGPAGTMTTHHGRGGGDEHAGCGRR